MRAAVLNGPIQGGPTEDDSIELYTDDPELVGTEVIEGTTRSGSFDAAKMIDWVATGAKVQAANKEALGGVGVDFGAMAKAMSVGAGAGAVFGGVGSIVGAAVGGIVYLAQSLAHSQEPRDWVDAAEGVHQWFTTYGPQSYLDWVRLNRPELLGSNARELTKGLLLYWLENDGAVITDAPGRSHYSGIPDAVYYNMAGGRDALVGLYQPSGVDYAKTRVEAHDAGTPSADGTSEGLGGVWQYDRKVYALRPKEDGPTEGGSGLTFILGAAAIAGGAYLVTKSNR